MPVANKSRLFANNSFRLPLPKGFPKERSTTYRSFYGEGVATLYRPALKGLLAFLGDGLPLWEDNAEGSDKVAGVGLVGDKLIVAEYDQGQAKHLAIFDKSKQSFAFVGITDDEGESYRPYDLKHQNGMNGTVLWLALLPYLSEQSNEIKSVVADTLPLIQAGAYNDMKKNGAWSEEILKAAFIFCNAVYYRVDRKQHPNEIKCNIPENGMFVPPDAASVKSGAFKPDTVISGSFTLPGLGQGNKKPKSNRITPQELFCKYALNPKMTDEERAAVATMPDWYVVPKWVQEAAHGVWFNHNLPTSAAIKQNNILLFGPPGGGKTEGAKAIASALGLPEIHVSMSANTDEEVVTGGIRPLTEDVSVDFELADLDMAADLDPVGTYKKITGQDKPDASRVDVLQAYMQKHNNSGGIRYTQFTPKVVEYIRDGGLVIFEEVTNVRDQGVIILLNQVMDGYQSLVLPSGECVKRHPNTVFVFAANVDEAQCNELETSTLSRLSPKILVGAPSSAEMVERVKSLTGFQDDVILSRMAKLCNVLAKHIEANAYIGVCGVRELTAWVLQYMALRDFDPSLTEEQALRLAALRTVVPGASPHKEDIEEIISRVLDASLSHTA